MLQRIKNALILENSARIFMKKIQNLSVYINLSINTQF